MTERWVLNLSTFAIALASSELYGAELDILPEITVSATRGTEGLREGSVASTVLSEETLSAATERDIADALRALPGVNITQSARGSSSNELTLRGAGGSGQLMLDGVPLFSTVTGVYKLSALPVDALDQIEVIRGPSAPRYGSRALGGVVRLTTREAREHGGFLHLEGGSFGSLTESLGLNLAGPLGSAALTMSRDDLFDGTSQADPANGNSERDGFRATQGILRLTAEPDPRISLNGTVSYTNSSADIDGPGILPGGERGLMDAEGNIERSETWVAQATLGVNPRPAWASSLQLGYTRNRSPIEAFGLGVGFDNRLLLARWNNHYDSDLNGGRGWGLSLGAEGRWEEGENSFDLPDMRLRNARGIATGFAELRGRIGAWGGSTSVHVDHYDDVGTHAVFYGEIHLGLSEALGLRASGGHGYRAPSFQELFFIPFFGNPALQPEQGWSGDAGVDWTPSPQARLSLTGFYSRYEDLIVLDFEPERLGLFASENVANARCFGLELEGRYALSEQVEAGVDYTYSDSRDLAGDRELPLQPLHQARAFGTWRLEALPLRFWAEMVYRGQSFGDLANRVELGDSLRVNLQANYRLAPSVSFYLRGENLNDDRTQEVFSLSSRGAAVFAGLRVDL